MTISNVRLKDVVVMWGSVPLEGFADDAFAAFAPTESPEPIARQPETGREAAQERLAAIVAEMERLIPGCTYVSAGRTHYTPRNAPKGHAFYLGLGTTWHMDGRRTVDVDEGSWIPALGALSDGGATLPDGESPEATARRLLGV
jgi:hypothetical protein